LSGTSDPVVYVPEPVAESALARLRTLARVETAAAFDWRAAADIVVVRSFRIAAADLAGCRRLSLIVKHGVGTDTIAVDAAAERGIPVVTTPGANARAVAELVLAQSLALARRMVELDRRVRAGEPGCWSDKTGRELTGRTAAVVGLGRIGLEVAGMLHRALDMRILGYDPAAGQVPGFVERTESLAAALADADLVTLHVPLLPATRNLIDAPALRTMRPDALLVDCARGGVVDEPALAAALGAGHLGGVALDVFAEEPAPADHPLLAFDRVVATPHCGGSTAEALERTGEQVVDHVARHLAAKAGAPAG
jgi:D-3-phosphoglycerate dehydrogenase